jgi:hypothetical protein
MTLRVESAGPTAIARCATLLLAPALTLYSASALSDRRAECPNPPGGSVACEENQMATCELTDGKIRGECWTPPKGLVGDDLIARWASKFLNRKVTLDDLTSGNVKLAFESGYLDFGELAPLGRSGRIWFNAPADFEKSIQAFGAKHRHRAQNPDPIGAIERELSPAPVAAPAPQTVVNCEACLLGADGVKHCENVVSASLDKAKADFAKRCAGDSQCRERVSVVCR